jgi:hypothetical protein
MVAAGQAQLPQPVGEAVAVDLRNAAQPVQQCRIVAPLFTAPARP